MTTRHALEPPTSGKVVLRTTHGEVHIDLWSREAPLACRNFIQLCLEGYFDNSPFYRVVLGFLVQVGPEGRDESIYGEAFRDEFHSRLKYSHRGMVAMVNCKMNDNKSHFFITTDKAEYLFRKNAIFGKVGNNTIYNVIRISEVDVDPTDRPLILPRILASEVIENPFEDIIPREISFKQSRAAPAAPSAAKSKAKVLISYEDDEEEGLAPPGPAGISSSHDVLDDRTLSKQTSSLAGSAAAVRPQVSTSLLKPGKAASESSEDEDFDLKMKKKVLAQREIFIEQPSSQTLIIGGYNVQISKHQTIISKLPAEAEFSEMKKNYLRLKANPLGSNNPAVLQEEQEMKTFLTPLQKQQFHFHSYNKKTKGRESETLTKLEEFIGKIQTASEDKTSWMSNQLRFSTDSSKAYSFNKDLPAKALSHDEDDGIVVDPTKRLKALDDGFGDQLRNLEEILSHENLLKISSKPK